MSDAVQAFHAEPSVEQMADELIADRKSRRSKLPWKPSRYRGLDSNRSHRGKYDADQRVKIHGGSVRKLSRKEIREWCIRMQQIVDPGSVAVLAPSRRAIV